MFFYVQIQTKCKSYDNIKPVCTISIEKKAIACVLRVNVW